MTTLFNRVIPCLLMQHQGLVKTRKFSHARYVGDPVNAIRIFNDKYVDELILLDISATRDGTEPDFDLIQRIAGECFMPLCYGGGIRSISQARRLIACGVEKLAINSMAIEHPEFLGELSQELGISSVVLAMDVKRDFLGRARVYDARRRRLTKLDPVAHAISAVAAGAGEVFLNSVDREGEFGGYDIELVRHVCEAVPVPVIACGGASSLSDMQVAIRAGASAAAAGSMFVFYGPHRAVLINYPEYASVRELFET